MQFRIALCLTALLFSAAPARAQRVQRPDPVRYSLIERVPAPLALQDTVRSVNSAPVGGVVLGGIIGGLVGGVGGALIGIGIEASAYDNCYEWCGLAGMVMGFSIGETLGVSTGVHMANDGEGSWALTTLASAAAFAGGALVVAGTGAAPAALIVPAGQLMFATAVQRSTAAAKAGR